MEPNTLEITEQPEAFAFTSIRELVNQTLNQEFGAQHELGGVPSGFRNLDQITGGFQRGRLYTVAVKPGMGKTAFLLSLANNMAIQNAYSVAILSAERSDEKMASRLIESETGMSISKLQSAQLKASARDHMRSLLTHIARASLYMDDTPTVSLEDLKGKVRQLKEAYKIDVVILDYLELLAPAIGGEGSFEEQLGKTVVAIRETARELDVAILLFSQVPHAALNGQESGRKPSISSLPDYLKNGADVLMFLHRKDIYPIQGEEFKKGGVELLVTRKGEEKEETVPLVFIESIAKFADSN